MTNAYVVHGMTTGGTTDIPGWKFNPDDVGHFEQKEYRAEYTAKQGELLPVYYTFERCLPVEDWQLPKVWRWGRHKVPAGDVPPPFLQNGAIAFVSPAVKAVMEAFDLGETLFYPVTILDRQAKVPLWDGPMYILHTRNRRTYVDMPEKPGFPAFSSKPSFSSIEQDLTVYWPLETWQIVVPELPADAPDIWKDPRIREVFFLSPRLAKALTKAGLSRGWMLKKTLTADVEGEE